MVVVGPASGSVVPPHGGQVLPASLAVNGVEYGCQHDRTPLLISAIVGRGPFQADFVASEKWFRRNPIDLTQCAGRLQPHEPCAVADDAKNEQAARLTPGHFLCLCSAPPPAPAAGFPGGAFVRCDMQK